MTWWNLLYVMDRRGEELVNFAPPSLVKADQDQRGEERSNKLEQEHSRYKMNSIAEKRERRIIITFENDMGVDLDHSGRSK